MSMNRRTFVIHSTLGAAALAATQARAADVPAQVDEKDPQAVAMGYKADAAKVDKTKFPKYAAGQKCGNCALYQGGKEAWGVCPIFGRKQVSTNGWCNAYAKKA